ncbi:arginine--tRNA ligase [cyanobacterium endosymbiont of Epithemia clementina EcSB]|uniref:arginine--tRNA ligase n=1 Tax=cyanobacterium endosymbiont of Epithemia clementina EcSB TaxID=3034674 RepID=UPI0024810E0C|nr:arginine--tRNA ligase [cyanobacterium endosymbiont of Epithemia clementina EcSB]WGT67345.1 arginine--tRNA ligase [cyanobacterium endosymbiont of Epithemia clementina EcSB]
MISISKQLNQYFCQALVNAFGTDFAEIDPLIVLASNPKFGDYQSNIALVLAKKLGKNPRDIAKKIIDNLALEELGETPTIAGPGFINIRLKITYLENQLKASRFDLRLGIEKTDFSQKVIVDFSSPNIAKEMHVGHLRSTIIGDCIARTLEFRGHQVLRLNHLGDWGTQFGMLIAYLGEVYPDALTTTNALDIGDLETFYKQAKQRFDKDEKFKKTARNKVVKLQAGDKETRHAWQLLCAQSRREFQVIYDRLDIKLTERGESFYNPFLEDIVKELDKQELLKEDAGAQCVFLDGFINKAGDPFPLIVKKSDGGYNYATSDLAALKYRVEEDKAERIIYVTDAGQANHFAQVFQVAKKANIISDQLEIIHVPFGLVKGEDGKRLKTRSGTTVKLRDLLDEAVNHARQDLEKRLEKEQRKESKEFIDKVSQVVGISAVKYADLSQNRTSDYVFSYEKMLTLQGNTAPYMLYAYARIQSISREGKIDFQKLEKDIDIILKEDTEIDLGQYLLRFNEVIKEVERTLLPNRLCDYLYELSKKFNRFYENCPVLRSEKLLKTSRLLLCDLTARTLKLGLSLLGISVLERM